MNTCSHRQEWVLWTLDAMTCRWTRDSGIPLEQWVRAGLFLTTSPSSPLQLLLLPILLGQCSWRYIIIGCFFPCFQFWLAACSVVFSNWMHAGMLSLLSRWLWWRHGECRHGSNGHWNRYITHSIPSPQPLFLPVSTFPLLINHQFSLPNRTLKWIHASDVHNYCPSQSLFVFKWITNSIFSQISVRQKVSHNYKVQLMNASFRPACFNAYKPCHSYSIILRSYHGY